MKPKAEFVGRTIHQGEPHLLFRLSRPSYTTLESVPERKFWANRRIVWSMKVRSDIGRQYADLAAERGRRAYDAEVFGPRDYGLPRSISPAHGAWCCGG
jgi:hypothetical protein